MLVSGAYVSTEEDPLFGWDVLREWKLELDVTIGATEGKSS